MRRIVRYALGLFVISAVLVTSGFAGAETTLNYSGETPTGSGYANDGIDQYNGSNYSDSLWDYVYDLSATTQNDGPFIWGIFVPYEPDHIFDPAADDWTGAWDSQIVTGEYNGAFDASDLVNHPGMVWQYGNPGTGVPATGTFHFQSMVL